MTSQLTNPNAPRALKSGWSTSEGQMVGISVALPIILEVLTAFNLIHLTPEQHNALMKLAGIAVTGSSVFALARSWVKAQVGASASPTTVLQSKSEATGDKGS